MVILPASGPGKASRFCAEHRQLFLPKAHPLLLNIRRASLNLDLLTTTPTLPSTKSSEAQTSSFLKTTNATLLRLQTPITMPKRTRKESIGERVDPELYGDSFKFPAEESLAESFSKPAAPEPSADLQPVNTSRTKLPFFFEPAAGDLEGLGLSAFEIQLLSSLLATWKLGTHLSRRVSELNGTLINELIPFRIDEATDSGKRCADYVGSALSTHLAGDKKFPLRLTGPSMIYIRFILPYISTSRQMFQLCIFRVFGFGDISRLQWLLCDENQDLDFVALEARLRSWTGPTKQKVAVPAYGNFMVAVDKISEILPLVNQFCQEAVMATYKEPNLPSFRLMHSRLVEKKIPFLSDGGLVSWLIVADLSEYEVCHMPVLEDLVNHMLKKGPSGPRKALELIAEYVGEVYPDADTLRGIVKHVWDVVETGLQQPQNDEHQFTSVAREVLRECEMEQSRPIGVTDLEHALCKISRQLSYDGSTKTPKANGVKGKTTTSVEKEADEEGQKPVVKAPAKKRASRKKAKLSHED